MQSNVMSCHENISIHPYILYNHHTMLCTTSSTNIVKSLRMFKGYKRCFIPHAERTPRGMIIPWRTDQKVFKNLHMFIHHAGQFPGNFTKFR